MKPLPFVWPWAPVFWLVFLWSFAPEFQIIRRAEPSAKRPDSADQGSVRVIMAGSFLASTTAFLLSPLRQFQFPAPMQRGAFVAGLALLIAGSLLRRHCWRMLGASFTGDVRAHAEQQVVTTGAYAFVRHPSYTAGTMMNTGIGIALGSWASALVMLVVSLVVYTYRMNVEERALLAAIGEPYRAFLSGRKRLIPYIY